MLSLNVVNATGTAVHIPFAPLQIYTPVQYSYFPNDLSYEEFVASILEEQDEEFENVDDIPPQVSSASSTQSLFSKLRSYAESSIGSVVNSARSIRDSFLSFVYRSSNLHLAVQNDDINALFDAIATSSDVNPADSSGNTPAYYAIMNDNVEALRVLFELGLTLEDKATKEHSILMTAVMNSKYKALDFMFASGNVNINKLTAEGCAPLEHVLHANNFQMATYLKKHGADTGKPAVMVIIEDPNAQSIPVCYPQITHFSFNPNIIPEMNFYSKPKEFTSELGEVPSDIRDPSKMYLGHYMQSAIVHCDGIVILNARPSVRDQQQYRGYLFRLHLQHFALQFQFNVLGPRPVHPFPVINRFDLYRQTALEFHQRQDYMPILGDGTTEELVKQHYGDKYLNIYHNDGGKYFYYPLFDTDYSRALTAASEKVCPASWRPQSEWDDFLVAVSRDNIDDLNALLQNKDILHRAINNIEALIGKIFVRGSKAALNRLLDIDEFAWRASTSRSVIKIICDYQARDRYPYRYEIPNGRYEIQAMDVLERIVSDHSAKFIINEMIKLSIDPEVNADPNLVLHLLNMDIIVNNFNPEIFANIRKMESNLNPAIVARLDEIFEMLIASVIPILKSLRDESQNRVVTEFLHDKNNKLGSLKYLADLISETCSDMPDGQADLFVAKSNLVINWIYQDNRTDALDRLVSDRSAALITLRMLGLSMTDGIQENVAMMRHLLAMDTVIKHIDSNMLAYVQAKASRLNPAIVERFAEIGQMKQADTVQKRRFRG